MFKYFPTNYVWNLSVDLAIEMGARIGEIEEMCSPLQEAAKAPDAAGTQAFRETWVCMADKLCELAEADKSRGRLLSAGEKLNRAAGYLITAERLQAHGAPGRVALYQRHLQLFGEGVKLVGENCERVEIPYEGKHLSALYVRAQGVTGRAPLLVQLNGLDSTKEMRYRVGLPAWLAQRGVSSLVLDQPGTGEALRLQGLTARYDTEHWASRVVDWLEQRTDVDPKRIGCEGVSLGGYYCPRAVAMEPRFACGVVWGANHDWRDVQRSRLEREGDLPVPHYWSHVCWVWGAKDIDDFTRIAEDVHLDGVVERIRVPFLVTHGEKDSQIPLKWAHRTFEQLVNSPKRELKIFTGREGGVQHSSFDNSINAGHHIADWVAETLGGAHGSLNIKRNTMNIIGPDALVFGVDDLAASRQYLLDYGLKDAGGGRFEAVDGTAIVVHGKDDPSLPPGLGTANMLRKTIYGVADSLALQAVAEELGRDREVKRLPDGSLEAVDDMGFVLGFQVTVRRPIAQQADTLNSPGSPPQRSVNVLAVDEEAPCLPLTLSHVVYFVPDEPKASAFYTQRLGFRVTDRLGGAGPFLRPAGTPDHHTLFLIQTPPHMKGVEHFAFHMAGPTSVLQAGYRFVAKGYQSFWGPGRHRMGSNWFWYFNSPLGCHVEYDADMDLHDDTWTGRDVPMSPDASQLFLFTSSEKWVPSGPPPGGAH